MSWSINIGSIAGIRLRLHVTFLLFIGWIAVSRGIFGADPGRAIASVALLLLIFSCVLLHELGHALAARRYGIPTRDITLLPIGGLARLQRMPDKPLQEIVVAIAGPAVNVALAVILFLFTRWTAASIESQLLQGGLVETLFAVNVIMVLFNMIPAFPMDGGRVLRAALALKLPYVRATQIASIVGQGIAVVFGLLGFYTGNMMLVFIAIFVFMAAFDERQDVRARATIRGLTVRDAMITDFHPLDVNEPLQHAVDLLTSGSQEDFPVLDGGVPVGVLTRADLVQGLRVRGATARVGEAAPVDRDYTEPSEPLDQAVRRMRERRRMALPVLEHGALVGVLTLQNVGELLMVREAMARHGGAPAR